MRIRIGTFNLNNLFSRFNFTAEIQDGNAGIQTTTSFRFDDPTQFRLRKYQGHLVSGKPQAARGKLALRIKAMDLDVLAVQEVEDIDTLTSFAGTELADLGYKHVVLVEGNDPRLIDVGLLSRLPIGGVTSWRHAVHGSDGVPVFSRDLLEVEIFNPTRTKRLVTVYNNHLKSHFVPFDQDQVAGAKAADERRRQQAEAVARIVAERTRPQSNFMVVGDMNDPPSSACLAPMVSGLSLVDGLVDAVEDRPAPHDDPPAPATPWTHRFKESHKPADYTLFDHVWLSANLARHKTGAGINRRVHLGGDGSDHDPAWVELELG
jgi:endonuclease/exonuclease/phosphatase family metal-dependent hydrolase